MKAVQFALKNTLIPLRSFLLIVCGFLLAIVILPSFNDDEPARLAVKHIGFEDGRIAQLVAPTGDRDVAADWSANIWDSRNWLICYGSGHFSYGPRVSPALMTPSQWTGGDCAMVEGEQYLAKASWTWDGEEGPRTITESFSFIYNEASTPRENLP